MGELERRRAVVVGALVAVLGYLGRIWARDGAVPLVWNDTADYLAASRVGLWHLDRLAGSRPVLLPFAISATSRDLARLAEVQALLAAVAWGVLAGVAGRCLPGTWRKLVAGAAVLVVSLAWQVSMWDQEVLTESLALTTLALVAAAAVWFAAQPTTRRAAALVATSGLWLLARDSHAVPVALGGAVLLVLAAARPDGRRLLALTGAYLVALSFLVSGAAHHGGRQALPLEHVLAVRVLPYPDRVTWFSGHGMPDGPALQALPEYQEAPAAPSPYTPVPPDPRWDAWRAWLRTDGQATFARYVATHPSYLWREPRRRPTRVFNDSHGLQGYKPLGQKDLPLLAQAYRVPAWAVWGLAIGAAAVLALRRRARWGPLGQVGAVLVATSLPHALLVWHADGMEAARHLLIPGVQLRVGALLLGLALLASPTPIEPAPAEASDPGDVDLDVDLAPAEPG